MEAGGQPPSFLSRLAYWSAHSPTKRLFTFLDDGGKEVASLSYEDIDAKTRALASRLLSEEPVLAPGDRALLVFLPSLDFIVAFIGCLRAGVVPVPVYPPDPRRTRAHVSAFAAIAASSGARLVLTHAAYDRVVSATALKDAAVRMLSAVFGGGGSGSGAAAAVQWPDLPWRRVEALMRPLPPLQRAGAAPASSSSPAPSALAFLQYTSGSTGTPKGVMITHANLAHNLATIVRSLDAGPDTVVASWLPQYHDMGLIGSYLGALYCGGSGVYMSPLSFVRRPAVWVEAASAYGATHLQSPNFGFRLAARKWREAEVAAGGAARAPGAKQRLDLSRVRHMFNAAEPVTASAARDFLAAFAPFGLHAAAMRPGYGLAEHTVYVCDGGDARLLRAEREALEGGRGLGGGSGSGHAGGGRVVVVADEPLCADGAIAAGDAAMGVAPSPAAAGTVELVTLGPVAPHHASGRNADIVVLIVDAATRRIVPDGALGEVWIASPSVAAGYWGLPALSDETFCGRLDGGGAGSGEVPDSATSGGADSVGNATRAASSVGSTAPEAPPPAAPLPSAAPAPLDAALQAAAVARPPLVDTGVAAPLPVPGGGGAPPLPASPAALARPDLHARYAATRFLRTGDVGAVVGGLLVLCGRGKDMLILRGKNYYPADAEAAVERADARVRPGCVAVFQARLRAGSAPGDGGGDHVAAAAATAGREGAGPAAASSALAPATALADAIAVAADESGGASSPVAARSVAAPAAVAAASTSASPAPPTPPRASTAGSSNDDRHASSDDDDDEGAVAALEVRDAALPTAPAARAETLAALSAAVRASVLRELGLRLGAVVLLKPHGVVKTTSGKVARRWNAVAWAAMAGVAGVDAAAANATPVAAAAGASPWGTLAAPQSTVVLHVWRAPVGAHAAAAAGDDFEAPPDDTGVGAAAAGGGEGGRTPSGGSGGGADGAGAALIGAALLTALRRDVAALLREPDPSTLDETSSLQDLGLDSLALAQLGGALAAEYGIRLPEGDLFSDGVTLAWLVEAAPALRRQAAATAATATTAAAAGAARLSVVPPVPPGSAAPPPAHPTPAPSAPGEIGGDGAGVEEVGLPPRRARSGGAQRKATWWESNCPCVAWWC